MPIRFAASVALLLLSFAPATRAQSAADGPLPVIAAHPYDAGTLRVLASTSRAGQCMPRAAPTIARCAC